MDGNGRVGRLLISLMLCERRVLPQPLLYLSAFLEQYDQEYKDCLLNVSRAGAWGDWITFFARGVTVQARDAVRRSNHLLHLAKQYQKRGAAGPRSPAAIQPPDDLFASPYVTVPRAAAVLGMTYQAALYNVNKLVEAG